MGRDLREERYEFLEMIRAALLRCRREIVDAARDMQEENRKLLAEIGFFTPGCGGNS